MSITKISFKTTKSDNNDKSNKHSRASQYNDFTFDRDNVKQLASSSDEDILYRLVKRDKTDNHLKVEKGTD